MAGDPRDPNTRREREEDTASLAKVHAAANPGAYMWGSWNPTRVEADRQGNVRPEGGAPKDILMEEVQRLARRVQALPAEARQAYVDAFLRALYGKP